MSSINAVHTISLDNANFQNNAANNGGGSIDVTCSTRKSKRRHTESLHESAIACISLSYRI